MKTVTFYADPNAGSSFDPDAAETGGLAEYHGYDNDGSGVDLVHGQSAKVSDEKAEQLVADFPDNFEILTGNAAKNPPEPPEPAEPAPPVGDPPGPGGTEPVALETAEQLVERYTRPELDAIATAAGIEGAAALVTKADVAEVIVQRR